MRIEAAVLFAFPALITLAAAYDLLTMTIPNRVNAAIVLAFPVAALVAGLDLASAWPHLLAGAAMLALGFALFLPGWIGGGDAKMFAACALWLGFEPLLDFALYASLVGGVLVMVALCARRYPLASAAGGQRWAVWLYDRQAGVPYGVALGVAALLIWPETVWFKALTH